MRFDSDSSSPRLPYTGRHRKEPSYVRAARNIRFPQLCVGSLLQNPSRWRLNMLSQPPTSPSIPQTAPSHASPP
jgi:hypothetical protein